MPFTAGLIENLDMHAFHQGLAVEAAKAGEVRLLKALLRDDIREAIYQKQLNPWVQEIGPWLEDIRSKIRLIENQYALLETQEKILEVFKEVRPVNIIMLIPEIQKNLDENLSKTTLKHSEASFGEFAGSESVQEMQDEDYFDELMAQHELIAQHRICLNDKDPLTIKKNLDAIKDKKRSLEEQKKEIEAPGPKWAAKGQWVEDYRAENSAKYQSYVDILYFDLQSVDQDLVKQDTNIRAMIMSEISKGQLPQVCRQVFLAENMEALQVAGWLVAEEDQAYYDSNPITDNEKTKLERKKAIQALVEACPPAVSVNTTTNEGYNLLALSLQQPEKEYNPLAGALLISYGADAFQAGIVNDQVRKPIYDLQDKKNYGLLCMLNEWTQFRAMLGQENWSLASIKSIEDAYENLQKSHLYEVSSEPPLRKQFKELLDTRAHKLKKGKMRNGQSEDAHIESLDKTFYTQGQMVLKKAKWQGHDKNIIKFLLNNQATLPNSERDRKSVV